MKDKKKWISILLAFLFGIFTFIYTWKKDKKLILYIILIYTFGFFLIFKANAFGLLGMFVPLISLWIILKVIFRPKEWYQDYYKG